MADYISSYTGAQIDSSVAYTQLHNSVHAEIDSKIASIESILSEHFGEDITDAIDTFDELKIFLNSYKNSDSLVTILTDLENKLKEYADTKVYDDSNIKSRLDVLEAKKDKDTVYDDSELSSRIAVLEAIDHTKFLVMSDLDNYALKTDLPETYNDTALVARVKALEDKEDKDTIYDDTEIRNLITTKQDVLTEAQLNNINSDHTKYLTEHQDLSEYALKTEIPSLEGYATESWIEDKNYLTEHQDLSDYVKTSYLESEIQRLEGLIKELEVYHSVVLTSDTVEEMTSEEAAVTNLRVSGTKAVESLSTSNNNIYKTLTISE